MCGNVLQRHSYLPLQILFLYLSIYCNLVAGKVKNQ